MRTKLFKRICSVILAASMMINMMIFMPIVSYAITDEDIPASVELGKGFNLLDCKTFESANLKSAILFDNVNALNPTRVRISNVVSNMTYITSMSSYLDNTHTDISTEVGVTKEGLLAKAEIKAKFGFKGEWESSGTVNTSRLILEIIAKAYKYSLNLEMSDPWAKDENGDYISINPTFAYDLVHMRPEDLFNTYGTHIVTQYDAGGEAYTSYEGTDASNSMKSEFDITANAEVKVEAKDIADVNVSVNTSGGEKHEESFANNNKQTSMRVRGGDPFYSTFDKIISGDADETINSWLQSMYAKDESTNSAKATMLQTDELKLMPLWELLEMDYGTDHSARVAQLRDYFQENANREYLELYEEFIYGIPGDYADNYDVVNKAFLTDEALNPVESAPADRIPIYTEKDLNKIGKSDAFPLDGNYTLMRDIEMKYSFNGIGYTSEGIKPFTGDFDGNGHTIYYLDPVPMYNGTTEVYMGFILYNKGNLYNIRFLDSNFDCRESSKTTASINLKVADTATAYLGLAVGRNVAASNSSNLSNIYIDNATFIIDNVPNKTYVGLAAGCIADTNFISDITVVNSHVDVSAAVEDGLYHIGAVCGASSNGAGMISHDNFVKCDVAAFVGGCIGSFVSDTNQRVETYSYNNKVQSLGTSGYQLSGYGDLNAYTFGGSDKYALTSDKLFKYYCDKENIVGGIGGYAEEWKIHSETASKPWLIVHAPEGLTAYQNSLISMKNLKVYFAKYGDETASYEDVTDRVNFVYDFSKIAEDVPVTVVYGKHMIDFAVDVVEPVVTDIAIVNTGKTQFRVGEKFDNSLFAGQILYSNNLTSSIGAGAEGLKVYIPEMEGDKPIDIGEYKFAETTTGTNVVVEYMGCTEKYQISVLPEDLKDKIHFSSNNAASAPGGEFEITISLNNNPGIVALSAYIEYNNDIFEVVDIKDAGLLPSFYEFEDHKPTAPLLWMNTDKDAVDNTNSGALATIRFKVKEGNYDSSDYGVYLFKCLRGEAFNKKGEAIKIPDMTFKVKLNPTTVGDINSDAVISSWDAVLLTRHTYDIPACINTAAADINRDGFVDDIDATNLNRYVVGFFGVDGAPGVFDVRVKSDAFADEILKGVTVNDAIPQLEEKFGYIFDGYYADAGYTEKIETLPAQSVIEIVIYAKYNQGYVIESDIELVNNIHVPGVDTQLKCEEDKYALWDVYSGESLVFTQTNVIPASYTPTKALRVEKHVEDYTGNTYSVTYVNDVECTYATENPTTYICGRDTLLTSPVSAENTSSGNNVVNFAGWYDNPEFDGLPITNLKDRFGDITLYAKWDRWTCRVSLDARGGMLEENILIHTYGTETILPVPAHSNPDYKFVRWVHNGNTITSIPATAYNSSKTYTYDIYAEWTYAPTITLTLCGSATDPDSKTEVILENVDAYNRYSIAEPSTGYVKAANGETYLFMGWYSKNTGAFVTNQYLENVEIDLSLEAKWEWIDTRIKVNFLDVDGTLIETVRVDYSEDLDMVESIKPEKAGYKLAGWTKEAFNSNTGELPYYPLYVPLDNVHNGTLEFNFYAYWVPENSVVQFTYSNDATGIISSGFATKETKVRLTPRNEKSQKITGIPYAELRVPANVYTYERTIWLNSSHSSYGFRCEVDSGAYGVSWLIYSDGSKYLLRYSHNSKTGNLWSYGRTGFGLTGSNSLSLYNQLDPPHTGYVSGTNFDYGTPPTINEPAAREGFTFGGWYDNPKFEGEPITEIPTNFRGDLIIYAKWISIN